MSLYNMVFGQNEAADVLLAILGLAKSDVGRFRDCWVENSDGELRIAVYTRNGGENRTCWCSGSGGEASHTDNTTRKVVERPLVRRYAEDQGYEIVGEHPPRFGGREMVVARFEIDVCNQPDSDECRCPGCLITYALPKHPLYVSDRDDVFDSTYATAYFDVPEEFREVLRSQSVKPRDMSQVWQDMISIVANDGEVIEKFRPVMEQIMKVLEGEQ